MTCRWEETPVVKKPAVERRAKAAAENLKRWERKLKLAKTKVAKYRKRCRYYERRQRSDTA